MSAESELFAALSGDSAITAIVGSRIYPVVIPLGVDLPAIAYQRTNTEYVNTIGNAALAARVTFDIACGGKDFDSAESLCDLVEALSFEKTNRTQTFDIDTDNFASVLTVNVWPE
jgi:hypothetical protein